MRKILFHIGLPKTATTFLQYQIFYPSTSIKVIHKKKNTPFLRKILKVIYQEKKEPLTIPNTTIQLCQKMFGEENVAFVLSHENISMQPHSIWTNEKAPNADDIAHNLYTLANRAFNQDDQISILLTIRRQDTWMASRYAQSGLFFPNPGQKDFVERIYALLDSDIMENLPWLAYASVYKSLSKYFSQENIHCFMQEELLQHPEKAISALDQRLGVNSMLKSLDKYQKTTQKKANCRSISPNIWQVKDTDKTIELTKELSRHILSKFQEENRQLYDLFGIDGSPYGYFQKNTLDQKRTELKKSAFKLKNIQNQLWKYQN